MTLAHPNSCNSQDNDGNDASLIRELPRARFWDALDVYQWEGGWYAPKLIKFAMNFRASFEAQKGDVLLASPPKTGTTWLKALCLCILRNHSDDILVKNNPHFNVPTVETMFFATEQHPDLHKMASPRLFHTHLPYNVLPNSIKNSDNHRKIVYIARNPKDTVVSNWHFCNTLFRPNQEPYPLDKAIDSFCRGTCLYGPFFDHVLGYWLESQKRPTKILFLKYEDLKRDPREEVKKLASFLGKPFADEEEVEDVLRRCSLERLKNLEVNKNDSSVYPGVPNRSYFRRGMVGDWKNFLTSQMEQQINQTARFKLEGSDLDFED